MGILVDPDAGAIAAPRMPEVGETLLGKYRIDAVIGRGGMGVVFEGYHLKLEQTVALKLLNAETAGMPEAVERFAREGRAAARLQGPHVARVFDVEETGEGVPFLVMERLRGEDLGKRLAREGRLAATQAVDYILEACVGLAEAHAKGVVHRDLKPENLYLAETADGSSVLKLLDFGISKLLLGHGTLVGDPTLRPGQRRAHTAATTPHTHVPPSKDMHLALTGAHTLIGTPRYMAPEQVLTPSSVDERADIWSLGVILYELLAGTTPFRGETATVLLISAAADPVPELPQDLNLPEGMMAVVQRCLMKDARERYPDIYALARDLAPMGGPQANLHLERVARYCGRSASPIPEVAASDRSQRPSRKFGAWMGLAAVGVFAIVLYAWQRQVSVPAQRLGPPPAQTVPHAETRTGEGAAAAEREAPAFAPTPESRNAVPDRAPPKAPADKPAAVRRPRNPLNVDIQR